MCPETLHWVGIIIGLDITPPPHLVYVPNEATFLKRSQFSSSSNEISFSSADLVSSDLNKGQLRVLQLFEERMGEVLVLEKIIKHGLKSI